MEIESSYHFECLRCGTQAQMTDLPPRCPKCFSGNGIVSERKLPEPLPIQPDPVTRAMAIQQARVDNKYFECLRCGHYTPFTTGTRPRCCYCGCMTGLVDNDTERPMFRFSRKNIGLVNPKDVTTDD